MSCQLTGCGPDVFQLTLYLLKNIFVLQSKSTTKTELIYTIGQITVLLFSLHKKKQNMGGTGEIVTRHATTKQNITMT